MITYGKAVVLSGVPVDYHFVARSRWPTLGNRQLVERVRLSPVESDGRSTLAGVAHGVSIGVDELCIPLDVRLGFSNPVDTSHDLEDRLIELTTDLVEA